MGLIAILILIEVIANIWWIGQINCEFEDSEIFQGFNDEKKRQLCVDLYEIKISGMELIPNQQSETISINSLGFRGDEFTVEKPDTTYRVFMLGGSTMFGHGATSDDTTIPGYLQQFLNEKNQSDFQIINSGIQGADSNTELKLLENKIIQFSPDLVIVYDGWNDLRAQNSPETVYENWRSMCKVGEENNFDVIIALQPIAGFGDKSLTKQEKRYSENGTNYNDELLINYLERYDEYASSLRMLENCKKVIDLRSVFDEVASTIYWDQGHVGDKGNSVVATSLNNNIFSIISKNNQSYTTNEDIILNKSSLNFNDREITVSVELFLDDADERRIKVVTKDNSINEIIENVTYFLSISHNNESLLREYFFAENGILVLDVLSDDAPEVRVIGEKQYDHNAYVTLGSSYSPDVSGESFTSEIPLQISGPIFEMNGIYVFDIELRTIDSRDNWIFNLTDFKAEINIENELLENKIMEDYSPTQSEDVLRKILSYYKTPVLLTEIFG